MLARNADDLGALLREARLAAGLSQAEVADMVGASRQWVINVEKGAATAQVGLMLDALRSVGLLVDVVNESTDGNLFAGSTPWSHGDE